MTDLNAGLEFGFLSSLASINFPASGLITVELLSGLPANQGTDQDVSIISWSSKAALPNYDVLLPDQNPLFGGGTASLGTIINYLDGPNPLAEVTAPVGLNYGGVGAGGGKNNGFFGTGLLGSLSGNQTFPPGLLAKALTWPQPYGMLTQHGDLANDAQLGAMFLSLKALASNPFNMVMQWVTGGATPLSGTMKLAYYSSAPKSFSLSNNFPLLTPSSEPTDQNTITIPFNPDPSLPTSYNVTVTIANGHMTVSHVRTP